MAGWCRGPFSAAYTTSTLEPLERGRSYAVLRRQAIRFGRLHPGDQLPSVREVVAKLAINPNTVLKAYRELEMEGLVTSRPGTGTFVREGLKISPLTAQAGLRRGLARWIRSAREAGLDRDDIRALCDDVVRESEGSQTAAGAQ